MSRSAKREPDIAQTLAYAKEVREKRRRMLATEREVFDRLVFNSTLELKAAQIKKQDEDRRTPYGESFQASLQMPTEAELESFLAEGTGNDAEDEDEKKDEVTTTEPLSEASLESLHAEPFFVDTVGTRGGGNDALEPGSPPVLPFDFIEGAAPNEIQTHTQARRMLAHLD